MPETHSSADTNALLCAASPSPAAASAWKKAVLLLLALIAIFTAYSPALSGGFVWDDNPLIVNAKSIHSLNSSFELFKTAFWNSEHGESGSAYFRPLVSFSYALDWAFWRGLPGGFHLSNILFHLLNAILVFLMARKWKARFFPALFSMALFGLLPRLTECVAWISGRTDPLACFFVLLSLLVWPKMPETPRRTSAAEWGCILLASLALFFGTLCKEVAFAGFAALFALEAVPVIGCSGRIASGVRRLVLPALAAAAHIVLRLSTTGITPYLSKVGSDGPSGTEHVCVILASIGEYVRMSVDFLRPEFQIGPPGAAPMHMSLIGMFAVIGALGLCTFVFHHRKALVTGPLVACLSLAVFALLPVIQILPQDYLVLAADRFLYLPAAAFFIALACLLPPLALEKSFRVLAFLSCIALLASCALATHRQSERWRTEFSLFNWGCEQDKNALACLLLGDLHMANGRPERALTAYRKIQFIEFELSGGKDAPWMVYSTVWEPSSEADALFALGECSKSAQMLQKMISQGDGFPGKTAQSLALALLCTGETDAAREVIRRDAKLFGTPEELNAQEHLIAEVRILNDRAGFPLTKAPEKLSDSQLMDALRLAEIFRNETAKTHLAAEFLRRGSADSKTKQDLREYLERRGICSVLPRNLNDFSYPEGRCGLVVSQERY